jgi:AraC-like DNA-binding protein
MTWEETGDLTGATSLCYFPAPPALRGLFGNAYLFEDQQPHIREHTRADFAQLRFMLAGAGDYLFGDGRRVPTPRLCLLGPTLSATHFDVQGPMRVLGVQLLPLGWIALGLGDASALADDVRDAVEQIGPAATAFMRRIEAQDDGEAMVEALWRFLGSHIAPVSEADRAFVAAVDAWLADERSPRLEVLRQATALSDRQLARLCNRLYGAPPKYLARKYRALRCALLVARGGLEWVELCDETFYDQSHLIREIKHFTGLTPNQLRDRAGLVMRLTMGRGDIDGYVPDLSRIS